MSHETVRDYLDENLAPLFPEGWRWVPYQRNLDALDAVTVTWTQNRIERLEAAPMGRVRVEGTLTILDPHNDIERAEEALDTALIDLTAAIDSLTNLSWTEAQKVATSGGTYLGWDVRIWTTADTTTSDL